MVLRGSESKHGSCLHAVLSSVFVPQRCNPHCLVVCPFTFTVKTEQSRFQALIIEHKSSVEPSSEAHRSHEQKYQSMNLKYNSGRIIHGTMVLVKDSET